MVWKGPEEVEVPDANEALSYFSISQILASLREGGICQSPGDGFSPQPPFIEDAMCCGLDRHCRPSIGSWVQLSLLCVCICK